MAQMLSICVSYARMTKDDYYIESSHIDLIMKSLCKKLHGSFYMRPSVLDPLNMTRFYGSFAAKFNDG